jgi:hypothetical protein
MCFALCDQYATQLWTFGPECAMPAQTPTTFLSYSCEDSKFALQLAQDLKAAGANLWVDQLDIGPGQEWDSAVEVAVTQAPQMLLILSPSSVKSRNVRNEIAYALDENKTIIPVLYQDCAIPLQLRRVQYVDLRSDYSGGLKVLLRTLGLAQQEERDKARLEQEETEHKAAAEKSKVSVQSSSVVTEDEVDEAWESERQKRENELTKAIVEEWSRRGTVHGNVEETQLIKNLRMALSEWLSRRPPGFESRQAQRKELQQAETKRAVDSWLRRKGR